MEEQTEAKKAPSIPAGWRSEHSLAGLWGLKHHELAEYRQSRLREGIHYGKPQGLAIYYSPEGIELAIRHFRPPSVEAVMAQKVASRAEELRQWAHPPVPGTPLSENICRVLPSMGNPRMVRVENSAGKVFKVKVRSNANFHTGMLLDLRSCRLISWGSAGPELYELMIPLPRFSGRWGWSALTNPHLGRVKSYAREWASGVELIPPSSSGES